MHHIVVYFSKILTSINVAVLDFSLKFSYEPFIQPEQEEIAAVLRSLRGIGPRAFNTSVEAHTSNQ